MVAHPFLLARARDINHGPYGAEARDSPGGHKAEDNAEERAALAPMTNSVVDNRTSHDGHVSQLNPVKFNLLNESRQGDQAADQEPSQMPESQTPVTHRQERGQLQNRMGELGGGSVLRRLKPLLDSFIREDKQRSGTLSPELFRAILVEGHGGLWRGLGASKAEVQRLTRYTGEDSLCKVNTHRKKMHFPSVIQAPGVLGLLFSRKKNKSSIPAWISKQNRNISSSTC